MNTRAAAASGQIKGWHVLALMLAFFGLVITVNIVFAVFAVGSFPGEEGQSPYQQGLRYNETLAERHEQAALGWRASADLEPAGAGGAAVIVTMLSRTGHPLDGLAVDGALRWPTDAARDQELNFTPVGQGRYRAALDALPSGNWRLEARASDAQGGARDFNADLTWR
ncbi:MAG: FixH family protein [Hyphomonadaceae bacterium]|nr:FixH family protein [Hyphomonadaceae bacterium]